MKSILVQQSPHSSPWAPTRLRQEMQTGGSRRSASAITASLSATAAEEALDRTACLKEISTPPIAMDAMIEPGAGRAEEARNA